MSLPPFAPTVMRIQAHACKGRRHRMHLDQASDSDRSAIESLAHAATDAAASALSRLLQEPVEVGSTRLRFDRLSDAVEMVASLPHHASVVYLQVRGGISGQMMLVLPSTTAIMVTRLLVADDRSWLLNAQRRDEVLAEVGNIVLSAFSNSIADACNMEIDPTTPLVATDDASAVLEGPIASAAGDGDLVVSFETGMVIGSGIGTAMRAPFQLIFLPTPGSLSKILHELDAREDTATVTRLPVRMGELVVSRRPGDVLVATALGSCIGVALVDRLRGVSAMAHIMLPESPAAHSTRPAAAKSYAPRFADTAIPALVEALEHAGGRRLGAMVYIAGGAQMFRGELATTMDVGNRNIIAVKRAIERERLVLSGDCLGGNASRCMEVEIEGNAVWVRVDGGLPSRLDHDSAFAA